MIERLRAARLLGPTLATVVGLAILLGLGAWQITRKVWKENLISAIESRTKAEPVELLSAYTATHAPQDDAIGLEYLRVKVRGHFLHGKERYFYAPDPELGPGVNIYTPFEIASNGPVVFVNRGFVPDRLKDPATRSQGQIAGELEVVGLVRQKNLQARFVPDNDPKTNAWYWRDIDALAKSAFPVGTTTVLPMVIDQEATATPAVGPKGGSTIVSLTNRHLEYAITWYGLAATLAAIFAVFAIGRLREPKV